MKKAIIVVLLLSLILCICSCDTQDQGIDQAAPNTTPSSSLGDYDVVIESSRLATDFQGNDIIIVKFKFTNNSEEPAAFNYSISCSAFQNGVGLNECYFADGSANFSLDNQNKEIKKGVTLTVEVAFELNDSTTDVEIEVSELWSLNNKKVTKIFSIK